MEEMPIYAQIGVTQMSSTKYQAKIYSIAGYLLGEWDLIVSTQYWTDSAVLALDPGPGSIYDKGGIFDHADIYKDNVLYARIPAHPDLVVVGQVEYRCLVIYPEHLIVTLPPKVCTCGVKFSGGLCSDWCDLVRMS
jgi:hypothetical protein